MATWVVGDIHGCYDDFMKLLSRKEIGKQDRIILIGDIIDRGPDSYKMLDWAMKNVSKTGRFQMVCGNHEDNIINDYDRCKRRLENGNHSVLTSYGFSSVHSLEDMDISALACDYDFVSYMEAAGYETVASVKPIVDWFRGLPLYKKVRVRDKNGKTKRFVIAHAWYREDWSRDCIVWYRDVDHRENRFGPDYQGKGNEILIHGHTPTQFCWSAAGKKQSSDVFFREKSINIDCGCVFKGASGKLAAIRLEDLKIIYV